MNIERASRVFPLTVALLTLLVFLPAVRNDFVNWDDHANFIENPDYRGLGWDQLRWMWTTHLGGRYMPLTWITLGLDYTLWEMDPLGYHLTSILFHAANTLLFYFIALALLRAALAGSSDTMRQRIPVGAFFAALFFALHPLRVESVAWVTERRDVVSGMFYLLAILAYLQRFSDRGTGIMRAKYYWASFAFFLMAILSKEIAVTLPVILLILDTYPLGRRMDSRHVWLEKIPFFIAGIADGALALYVGTQQQLTASLAQLNWFSRIAICTYGLAFYLRKTLAPLHLGAFYALNSHRVDPRALPFELSAVIVILTVIAAVIFRRKFPGLLMALLAYAITLLPVVGIFHNGQQITADRYSYLACLGWALLAGGGFLELSRHSRGRVFLVAAALVLSGLSYLTWRQIGFWRDSETLWAHTMEIEPSAAAQDNWGLALSGQGDLAGGIRHYRQALEIDPNYESAHNNLGISFLLLGDREQAVREFQSALKIDPSNAVARRNLDRALAEPRP